MKQNKASSRLEGNPIWNWVTWALLAILAAFWMIPFVFMFLTAVKSNQDIAINPPWSLPKIWEWHNYKDSWLRGDLRQVGMNSFIISMIKVPLGLLISSLAAFALSK